MLDASSPPLTFALPKGRILDEALPLMARAGLVPEASFHDKHSRALMFACTVAGDAMAMRLIRVRAFDVATFVAHGAAQAGIVGSDVIEEFAYPDLYAPVDLGIGPCRLAVAEPAQRNNDRLAVAEPAQRDNDRLAVAEPACHDKDRLAVAEPGPGAAAITTASIPPPRPSAHISHVRVASKYPNLTRRHFAKAGIQAEVVRLSGALELAPGLGLAEQIVDLVATGRTLAENGLVETATLLNVSARLIVNRAAFKTDPRLAALIARFRALVAGDAEAAA